MLTNITGSKRTTYAGLLAIVTGGLGAALLDQAVAYFSGSHLWWVQLIGLALGAIGPALMKDAKQLQAELSADPQEGSTAVPPKVASMLILFALVFAVPFHAHAQEVPPTVDAPLVLRLNADWTLRPNVTVGPLVGYVWDLDTGKGVWRTNVSIGGLYVFDWRAKFCAGAGATVSVGASKKDTTLGAVLMVGGPAWKLLDGAALRPAIVGQYTAAGGVKSGAVLGTLALSF